MRQSDRLDPHQQRTQERVYDKLLSPYQRLLDTSTLDDTTRAHLGHATLNPARITRRINTIQHQLIELAKARTQGTPAA